MPSRFSSTPVQRQSYQPIRRPFHSPTSSSRQANQATSPQGEMVTRRSLISELIALNAGSKNTSSANFWKAAKPLMVACELGWNMKKFESGATWA